MNLETFAKRLRLLRLEKGLSCRQLDAAAGIANTTTSKLEVCKRKAIGFDIIEALANALGTTPAYLSGGGEAPAPAEPPPDLRSPVVGPLLGDIEEYMVRANATEMIFRRTAKGMTVIISSERVRGRAGKRG